MSSGADCKDRLAANRPAKGKVLYSEEGCDICGSHLSSSFRSCPETSRRLCNKCHCKSYRLKRKFGSLGSTRSRSTQQPRRSKPSPGSSDRSGSALDMPTPPRSMAQDIFRSLSGQQDLSGAGLFDLPAAAVATATTTTVVDVSPTQSQDVSCPQSAPPHSLLAALQQRVFDEHCSGAPTDALVLLHCARRAQQATPACSRRLALAVLPRLSLRLPDDPTGLLHTMSGLVEAVLPVGAPAPPAEEAGGDSEEHAGARLAAPSPLGAACPPPSIRLTLFAAAGAVACWHEAPAETPLRLGFSAATQGPVWSTGLGGFTLHFPHAFDPQLDLFASVHQRIAMLGHSAMQQPTIDLEVNSWAWGQAQAQAQAPSSEPERTGSFPAFTPQPNTPEAARGSGGSAPATEVAFGDRQPEGGAPWGGDASGSAAAVAAASAAAAHTEQQRLLEEEVEELAAAQLKRHHQNLQQQLAELQARQQQLQLLQQPAKAAPAAAAPAAPAALPTQPSLGMGGLPQLSFGPMPSGPLFPGEDLLSGPSLSLFEF